MERKVSRSVWIWKVPGVSAVGRSVKDSSGVTASEAAVRRPILSQERYLHHFGSVTMTGAMSGAGW
jgi:hypothetical protein